MSANKQKPVIFTNDIQLPSWRDLYYNLLIRNEDRFNNNISKWKCIKILQIHSKNDTTAERKTDHHRPPVIKQYVLELVILTEY